MRVLVISDIHGNSVALKEIIERNEFDDLWVVGDLVDYGPDPGGVIDWIKELDPSIIVRGNHDHAAAYNVDCGCGSATHELSVLTRERITLQFLSRNDLDWLGRIPLNSETSVDEENYYVVHGSPRDPLHGYLYYHSGKALLESSLNGLGGERQHRQILIHGHTHFQGSIHYKDILLINPGSVGQPRDGDWRGSYLLIETQGNEARYVFGRVKYEVEKVVKQLERYNLPKSVIEKLARILRHGKVG